MYDGGKSARKPLEFLRRSRQRKAASSWAHLLPPHTLEQPINIAGTAGCPSALVLYTWRVLCSAFAVLYLCAFVDFLWIEPLLNNAGTCAQYIPTWNVVRVLCCVQRTPDHSHMLNIQRCRHHKHRLLPQITSPFTHPAI